VIGILKKNYISSGGKWEVEEIVKFLLLFVVFLMGCQLSFFIFI